MMKKIKHILNKCGCIFIGFILVFSLFSIPVRANEGKIRVGWYEDSYHITGKKGKRSGYGYEYEQTVAGYTGWKYEYVKDNWSDLLEKLKNGDIDLMAAISYTDERAQEMLFSELPMGKEKYYLYADLVNSNIDAADLKTLNGKRVAMLEKSVQATQFFKWKEKNNIDIQPVYVESLDDAMEKASKYEIDCVISTETPIWVDYGMSAIVTTGESDIYYAINKNRPDLKEELDNAMHRMEYDKPFYADDLYKKYLSTTSAPVLSKDEIDWVSKHKEIRIGCLNDDDGFSHFDEETGRITGVITDYIMAASDCLSNQKLLFNFQSFDSQDELLKALKNDEIDMIFHVSQNPYIAEKNDFILSNTVMSINVSAVTSKIAFNENDENTVAIEKGNLSLKWYVSYNYPKWKIKEYGSLEKVEKAVRQGQVDCFIAETGTLSKYTEDKFLYMIPLSQIGNASFAVNRKNTLLLSILNKTLKTMPTSMLTGALSIYNDTSKNITVIDYIKEHLLTVTFVFVSIFLLVVGIILRFLNKARVAEAKAKEAAYQTSELNKRLEKSQAELQVALSQAESANEAKTNFLSNMSHDIRTPMNALLGYTQLMNKQVTDPQLLYYQDKIEQSGNMLLSIIDNVLDMSRIESGKMELDENYAYVDEILKEIEGVFGSEIKEKEIELTLDNQVIHQHILCDVTKVQQILLNLVSNAIKYTPAKGKVIIRLQELPCQSGFIKIKTEVIDTGIGMSQTFIPTLFDAFTRERNTTIGKVAGTGLGMPIVKKLVDMMGGTIDVESELGKGSKFTVVLKHHLADEKYYAQVNEDLSLLDANKNIRGKHILLAEDNDLNAEITITLLEDMGLIVERVEDGIQCVAKMEQMPAKSYDLILMDIQMPHMDGYKATQTIRQLSNKDKATIPIIALTANAFEEDRKKAVAQGMNGHISKPMDVDKIEKVLLSILK